MPGAGPRCDKLGPRTPRPGWGPGIEEEGGPHLKLVGPVRGQGEEKWTVRDPEMVLVTWT